MEPVEPAEPVEPVEPVEQEEKLGDMGQRKKILSRLEEHELLGETLVEVGCWRAVEESQVVASCQAGPETHEQVITGLMHTLFDTWDSTGFFLSESKFQARFAQKCGHTQYLG